MALCDASLAYYITWDPAWKCARTYFGINSRIDNIEDKSAADQETGGVEGGEKERGLTKGWEALNISKL